MSYLAKAPVRASHRYIARLLQTDFKDDQILVTPVGLDSVNQAFLDLGGSWSKLFLGSAEDIGLLRSVITAAIKYKFLIRQSAWK